VRTAEGEATPAPRPSVLTPAVAASRCAAAPRRLGLLRPPAQRAALAAPRLRAAAACLGPAAREAGEAPPAAGQSAHQAEPPRRRRSLAPRDERSRRRCGGRLGCEMLLASMLSVGALGYGRTLSSERSGVAFVGRGAHPGSSLTHSPGAMLVGVALGVALFVALVLALGVLRVVLLVGGRILGAA
jgi:hypothetical protein